MAAGDPKFRRLRVLHLVGGDGKAAPNPLLIPLLTRGNRQRIEGQVLSFVPGDARLAVVRQSGLPVHETPLSRARFSPGAFFEARKVIAEFKPDVLHAWGSSAQIVAALLAGGKKSVPLVWSVTRTSPLQKGDGWIDRNKWSRNLSFAPRCQSIVYPSAVSAANYRRAGLPDGGAVIAPGVDADRFKPDDAARQRVRAQFELPPEAVLIGMYAPFLPEFDHMSFMKAVGELVKSNPNLYCVLAGRGTVKGNSALSTLIGGGVLGTRTRIVGEWTDLAALFNACDVVCSSAQTDAMRLTLAVSMLCGTLCAATGTGAQGEVLGGFGATVEPGSIDAMVRGVRRILEMPPERKAFMAQAARNHILQNFNMARSIEKYHELYAGVAGGAAAEADTKLPKTETAAPESPAKVEAKPVIKPLPTKLPLDAVGQLIAERAQTTAKNLNRPAPKKEATEAPPEEPATGFGSVQASSTPLPVTPPTSEAAAAPVPPKSSDSIDFSVLAVEKPVVTPARQPIAEPVAPSAPTEHWTEADESLMEGVLVEADPQTAKIQAEKAAAAQKAAAAKAAANAAFAALAGGDMGKGVDPRMLAAALNLSGAKTGAPRVVAGKPPGVLQPSVPDEKSAAAKLPEKTT